MDLFWTFHVSRSDRFAWAGVGTSWHVDVFDDVWKIVLRGRRNTFATFSEHGRRSGRGPVPFFVAGAALQTCRESCLSKIALARLWSGDRVQIAWQAWHFVTCAEIWRKASHLIYGRSCKTFDLLRRSSLNRCLRFAVSMGEATKTFPFRSCPKRQNCRTSRTKCSFSGSHMWQSSGSLWFTQKALPYLMGEATETLDLFEVVKVIQIGGGLARNASFSSSHMSQCWVSDFLRLGFAVSMGEATKPLFFEVDADSVKGLNRDRYDMLVLQVYTCYIYIEFLIDQILGFISYLWGTWLKTFPFRSCQSVKTMEDGLARNARFQAPTCAILSLWLYSAFSQRLRSVYRGISYKTFTFRSCQSVKVGGWSRTKCSFSGSHMSPLESLAIKIWLLRRLRRIYRGSYKTFPFRSCQSVKTGGGLARNARFQAHTCLLLSLWLSSNGFVSIYGGSYKTFDPFCRCCRSDSNSEQVSATTDGRCWGPHPCVTSSARKVQRWNQPPAAVDRSRLSRPLMCDVAEVGKVVASGRISPWNGGAHGSHMRKSVSWWFFKVLRSIHGGRSFY